MENFKINFIISLKNNSSEYEPYGPLFHRFLPDGKKDAIIKNTENYIIKFWFEQRGFQREITGFIDYIPNEKKFRKSDIKNQAILDAGYLYGQIELLDLDDEIKIKIFEESITDTEFEKIGKKTLNYIYSETYEFVSILKYLWGQYWLKIPEKWDSRVYSLGHYFNYTLNAKYYNEQNKKWIEFIPNEIKRAPIIIKVTSNEDYSDYISKSSWKKINEIFNNEYKVSKAIKYLQIAHQSYDSNNYSKAYIDIVTALEFVIEEFYNKRKYSSEKVNKKYFKMNELPISVQFTNICIIGNYCNEDELDKCIEVIEIRNKIVHEGLVISNNSKAIGFYCLTEVLKRIIGEHYCFYPKKNKGNEIRSRW